MFVKIIFALISTTLSLLANHQIEVSDAYVKQTPPNAKNTAIFLTLKNKGDKDLSLINATTNLSEKTELHTHIHENKKMSMVPISQILLKAHSETKLQKGGLHIMVLDLKEQVDKDTKTNLILYFDDDSSIEVKNIPSIATIK